MTIRFVAGLAWSLLTGMAGGWLALAPWALGEQPGGDWTAVTRNEFFGGLGLIVLALLGLVVVVVQATGTLREAGVLAPSRATPRPEGGGVATPPDMEKALIALAEALAQDLDTQHAGPAGSPAPGGRAAGEPAGVAAWRNQR